jgi:predicted  nucleic acid-binding Zn-ribbon protein
MEKKRKIVGIWAIGDNSPKAEDGGVMTGDEANCLSLPTDDGGHPVSDPQELLLEGGESYEQWAESPVTDAARISRSAAALGIGLSLLALAWIGWATFIFSEGFTRVPDPPQLATLVATLCAPLGLLLLVWLWAERGSARSVRRHVGLLRALREEQERMVERVAQLDSGWRYAQLTLEDRARHFATGAVAAGEQVALISERLDGRLQAAVQAAQQFANVTDNAARQMDGVTVALPKVDEVATRVVDQLRDAGRSAYQMGGILEERLASLSGEAQDAEQALAKAAETLDARRLELAETGQQAENVLHVASQRFDDKLKSQREAALAMLADLATSLETSIASVEARVDATRSRFAEENAERFALIDADLTHALENVARLSADIAAAGGHNAELRQATLESADAANARLATLRDDTQSYIGAAEEMFSGIDAGFERLSARAAQSYVEASRVTSRVGDYLAKLSEGTSQAERLLPASLATLESHIGRSEDMLARLSETMQANIAAADEALTRLHKAEELIDQQSHALTAIEQMSGAALSSQTSAVDALKAEVAALSQNLQQLRDDTAPSAFGSIEASTRSAQELAEQARAAIVDAASGSAEDLKTAIDHALDSVLGAAVVDRMAELANASQRAVTAANTASNQLIHQLSSLNDRSDALETRIDDLAGRAEENSRETLARQMTAATEALQSLSVDMTRLLDTEVTDQAWDAYLRGDRGIFSRRALRLLTGTEQRAVLKRYQSDEEFRSVVNRYVQEFESMLRGLVDRRDGNPLMVTLLSSDIGKVYVALAQSIERLRN